MKILFAGGGTGGHFYPIIAVAEKINEIADKEKILEAKLYYMSNRPYDKAALFENGIEYVPTIAGKMRTYFSIKNFFDLFKIFFGALISIIKLFFIYPDVIFSKGGYASFPTLLAAKLLMIPVFIHESDSAPGRVNIFAGKFAQKIAVSFDEAGRFFPKEKTAWTGQPIRKEIQNKAKEGAFEYLKLEPSVPVIWVVGGSQGAQVINEAIMDALPTLMNSYQIIHQIGPKNIKGIEEESSVILEKHPNKERYKPFAFLNPLAIKMCAGASTLIISRAGSMIFEIANWGTPSIIIPITNTNGDHQRQNAYNYARAGGRIVTEEANLTRHILVAEIEKLLANKEKMTHMSTSALAYAHPDAAEKIARELINIGLSHEE